MDKPVQTKYKVMAIYEEIVYAPSEEDAIDWMENKWLENPPRLGKISIEAEEIIN